MNEVARQGMVPAELQEKVLLGGDLARLTPAERLSYYNAVCTSVGLNPLTRPFEYLVLNDRMVLYARKDCTDQLRDLHGISIEIVSRDVVEGVLTVTARATNMTHRTDESIGAVPFLKEEGDWKVAQSGKRYFVGTGTYKPLGLEDRSNAIMKAETKAKRRVTLSLCGLGILDETEIDTVPPGGDIVDATPTDAPPSEKPSLKSKLEGKAAKLKAAAEEIPPKQEGATLASQARTEPAEPKAVDTIPTEDPVGAGAPSDFSKVNTAEVVDVPQDSAPELSLYEKIVGEMQAQTTVKDLMAVMNDMRKVAAKLTQQERAVILQLKNECLLNLAQ